MVFNVEPGIHVERYGGTRLRPVRGEGGGAVAAQAV
jgi:hypothetical protein